MRDGVHKLDIHIKLKSYKLELLRQLLFNNVHATSNRISMRILLNLFFGLILV